MIGPPAAAPSRYPTWVAAVRAVIITAALPPSCVRASVADAGVRTPGRPRRARTGSPRLGQTGNRPDEVVPAPPPPPTTPTPGGGTATEPPTRPTWVADRA